MKVAQLISKLMLLSLFLLSCSASTSNVKRVNAKSLKDLSGYWNDTDSRMVSEDMVGKLMNAFWIGEFSGQHSRKPIVVVGKVRNKTSEHIDTSTFIRDLEAQLINSGRISFVSGNEDRDQIRKEKIDQQTNSNFEDAKELGNEKAADFMLLGQITSITDKIEGEKVVYYQINLELVAIETNEKK